MLSIKHLSVSTRHSLNDGCFQVNIPYVIVGPEGLEPSMYLSTPDPKSGAFTKFRQEPIFDDFVKYAHHNATHCVFSHFTQTLFCLKLSERYIPDSNW